MQLKLAAIIEKTTLSSGWYEILKYGLVTNISVLILQDRECKDRLKRNSLIHL